MSMGIYIKGLPLANANGIYNIVDDTVISYERVWLTVDGLYRLAYTEGDVIYEVTSDIYFDVAQSTPYYIYDATTNTYVQYTEEYTSEDAIADVGQPIYEATNDGHWYIEEVSTGTLVYRYSTTDAASSPYDTDAEWVSADGTIVDTIDVEYWDESSFTSTTSDPVYDEEAGTTTTVTTTTNLITGSVYTETNVVRDKTVYETKELVRYDNVSLSIGKVYRFQFVSDFTQIGYDPDVNTTATDNAGIYRVDKVSSLLDIMSSGIDLYANLYKPLAISRDVYESDLSGISDSIIYKLVDPTDEKVVYYMPQSFIQGTPDASVEEYNKLLLTIDFGIHGDVDFLSDVTDTLTQVCEKLWGVQPETGKSLIDFSIYDNIWLTTAQKDTLDADRLLIKNTSSVDLDNILQLQQTNAIYLENIRLKGRVGVLEEILFTKTNNS